MNNSYSTNRFIIRGIDPTQAGVVHPAQFSENRDHIIQNVKEKLRKDKELNLKHLAISARRHACSAIMEDLLAPAPKSAAIKPCRVL